VNLVQLDLSENMIQSIDSLSCLPKLSSLNISKNLLSSSKSITHLSECKTLANVDFSHNKLEGESILDVLSLMKSLLSINIVGNPVVNNVSNFRKRCIGGMKLLRYLDKPIFEDERVTVEAWVCGGREAELEMKKKLHEQKLEEGKKKTKEFRAWQKKITAQAEVERQNICIGKTSPEIMIAAKKESSNLDKTLIDEELETEKEYPLEEAEQCK